jgi:hypothetical protein
MLHTLHTAVHRQLHRLDPAALAHRRSASPFLLLISGRVGCRCRFERQRCLRESVGLPDDAHYVTMTPSICGALQYRAEHSTGHDGGDTIGARRCFGGGGISTGSRGEGLGSGLGRVRTVN